MVVNVADLRSPSLLKYGGQLNLDMTAFSACLSDKKYPRLFRKTLPTPARASAALRALSLARPRRIRSMESAS